MDKKENTIMEPIQDLFSQNLKNGSSRRNFFTKSFMAAGAAAVATSLSAQTTTTTTTGPSDIDILNYALTLENHEAAFYNGGTAQFAATDFANSTAAGITGTKATGSLYDYLKTIRDHENLHVATLQTVIKTLGGTPVPACTYNFGYKTPDDFLMIAMILENTGVMAYDGAISLLKNKDLVTAGATIATVEARHAAYLNLVNSAIPFPNAFDMPQTMAQILAAAGQFIGSCPTTMAVASPKTLQTFQKQIFLDGTASMGATAGALTYSWRVVSGSAALFNANSPTPSVQFNGGYGTYVFELTVTDSTGKMSKDTASVLYLGR